MTERLNIGRYMFFFVLVVLVSPGRHGGGGGGLCKTRWMMMLLECRGGFYMKSQWDVYKLLSEHEVGGAREF